MEPIQIGGIYTHVKSNKRYLLLDVAKHSETLQEMAIYVALYGKKQIWIRPLEMFLDGRFKLYDLE